MLKVNVMDTIQNKLCAHLHASSKEPFYYSDLLI